MNTIKGVKIDVLLEIADEICGSPNYYKIAPNVSNEWIVEQASWHGVGLSVNQSNFYKADTPFQLAARIASELIMVLPDAGIKLNLVISGIAEKKLSREEFETYAKLIIGQ